jgi:DNA adenine methylase
MENSKEVGIFGTKFCTMKSDTDPYTSPVFYTEPPEQVSQVEDLFVPYAVGAKPVLKWAGGKSSLMGQLVPLLPSNLSQSSSLTYFEPFMGGGAMFFTIVQLFDIRRAFLFDINEDLVLTYKVIQGNVQDLIAELGKISRHYLALDHDKRIQFYYEQRKKFNENRKQKSSTLPFQNEVKRAAQLIFLNKTCFNGLYRVNARGDFNTPAGAYTSPKILDWDNLLAAHHVLQIAEIACADYAVVLKLADTDSFVYFDPPYRPLNATSNFNSYTKDTFDDTAQTSLATVFKGLDKMGAKVMLSNSDPKNHDPEDFFFDKLYSGFNIHRIQAKRMINSDATKRGEIKELVITNYDNYHGRVL